MYKFFFKRLIDIVASLFFLIIMSPVIIILSIITSILMKGNPYFFQKRPGKDERIIEVIKFKSMNDKKDIHGNLLPDVERIIPFGNFIRKSSFDELPQLINVIKGDMSLVGPRPLLFKYIPLFNDEQRRRHNVKPGITGLAQVNGRNSISWTKKFDYDIYYVDNMSFLLDLKILWLTALKVFKKEGVNQSAERPMNPFNGFN